MHRQVDAQRPIPIRRLMTEPCKHVIEGGSAARETEHAIKDLKRSGYRPLLP